MVYTIASLATTVLCSTLVWQGVVQLGFMIGYANAGAVCPGELYFYVLQESDNREVYIRLKAPSVDDCVRKCYADDFCFSALFNPKAAPEEADCLLSYISGFNCTRKKLASSYPDNSRSVIAECLRCPENGELVSLPPFPIGTEEPGVNTTAGIPTEVTEGPTTPTEPEVVEVRRCVGTLSFVAAPTESGIPLPQADKITHVTDPTTCAVECYAHGCTKAVYNPPSFHVSEFEATPGAPCLLSFDQGNCTGAEVTVQNTTLGGSVSISCVDCTLTEPILIPENVTEAPIEQSEGPPVVSEMPPFETTLAGESEMPPVEVTTGGAQGNVTEQPVVEVRHCIGQLTFVEAPIAADMPLPQAAKITQVANADTCARECYAHGCSEAVFSPPSFHVSEFEAAAGAPCMLSFDPTNCTGTEPKVQNATIQGSVLITCADCTLTEPVLIPENVTEAPIGQSEGPPVVSEMPPFETTLAGESEMPPVEVTTGGAQGNVTEQPVVEVRHCIGQLTFVEAPMSADKPLPQAAKITQVANADTCARECYAHGCSEAVFSPPSFHVSEFEAAAGAPCMLSFDPTNCTGTEPKVQNATIQGSVLITCADCTLTEPVLIPENVTEAPIGQSEGPPVVSGAANTAFPSACPTDLTFELIAPDQHKEINFTEQSSLNSAKQCAELCYSQHCVVAGFVPPIAAEAGVCLLAYQGVVECAQPGGVRVTDYNGINATGIQCVQCESGSTTQSYQPSPITVSESPSQITDGGYGIVAVPGQSSPATSANDQTVETSAAVPTPAAPSAFDTTQQGLTSSDEQSSATAQTTAPLSVAGGYGVVASEQKTGISARPACTTTITFEMEQASGEQQDFPTVIEMDSGTECAKLCYERHCVTAGYSPAMPDLNVTRGMCMLSFDAQERCSNNTRLAEVQVTAPVRIDCVRCEIMPPLETTLAGESEMPPVEVTTGGAQGNVTEQPVVEVRHCIGQLTFVEAPMAADKPLPQAAKITQVANADTCARECYAHGCSEAVFSPPSFHVSEFEAAAGAPCILSFDPTNCTGTEPKVQNATIQGSVLITCADCTLTEPVLIPENTTEGVPPTEVVPGGESPATPSEALSPPCAGGLTFVARPASTSSQSEDSFSMGTAANGTTDCAGLCYSKGCTTARYVEPTLPHSVGTCMFSFANASQSCADASPVSTYGGPFPVEISCAQCGSAVVANPALGIRQCPGQISFVASPANAATPTPPNSTVVATAQDCALECYAHNCSTAVFHPIGFHVTEFSSAALGVVCFLSFDPQLANCSSPGQSKVTVYNTDQPTAISCVECSGVTGGPQTVFPEVTTEFFPGVPSEPSGPTVIFPEVSTQAIPVASSEEIPTLRQCAGNLSFVASPGASVPMPSIAKVTHVQTVKACAMECYAHGCTEAVFKPTEYHESEFQPNMGAPCVLSFDPGNCTGTEPKVEDYNSTDSTLITCFDCSLTVPVLIPENETQVPPVGPSEGNETGQCVSGLTFEVVEPEGGSGTLINFTEQETISSASACAQLCYSRQCVIAGYSPPAAEEAATCFLAFTGERKCGQNPAVADYNGTAVAELHCVQCGGAPNVSAAACSGSLTFDIAQPGGQVDTPQATTANYTEQHDVQSSMECADLCYSKRCIAAGYMPSVNGGTGVCLLSFVGEAKCGRYPTTNDYNGTDVIEMNCIKCNGLTQGGIEIPPGVVPLPSGGNETSATPPPVFPEETPLFPVEGASEATLFPPGVGEVTPPVEPFGNETTMVPPGVEVTGGLPELPVSETPLVEEMTPGPEGTIMPPLGSEEPVFPVFPGENETTIAPLMPELGGNETVPMETAGPPIEPGGETAIPGEGGNETASVGPPIAEIGNVTEAVPPETIGNVTAEGGSTLAMPEIQQCAGNVSFITSPVETLPTVVKTTMVISPLGCALECYAHGCTQAVYRPPSFHATEFEEVSGGVPCLLSFDAAACEPGREKVQRANNSDSMVISCIDCSYTVPAAGPSNVSQEGNASIPETTTPALGIEALPGNVTEEGFPFPEMETSAGPEIGNFTEPVPLEPGGNITGEGSTAAVPEIQQCAGNISFAVSPVATLPSSVKTTMVISPVACAMECYGHGCTQAVYRPPSFHPTEFEEVSGVVPCLLSFDPVTCQPGQPKVESANGADSMIISCIDCSFSVPVEGNVPGPESTSPIPLVEGQPAGNETGEVLPVPPLVEGQPAGNETAEVAPAPPMVEGQPAGNETAAPALPVIEGQPEGQPAGNETAEVAPVPPVAEGQPAGNETGEVLPVPPVVEGQPEGQPAGNETAAVAPVLPVVEGQPEGQPAGNETAEVAPALPVVEGQPAGNETGEVLPVPPPEATGAPVNVSPSAVGETGGASPTSAEPCTQGLTFEAFEPAMDASRLANFTEQELVSTVVECAQVCYNRKCTAAGITPSVMPGKLTCLMSHIEQPVCGQHPRVPDFNATAVLAIQCIECGGAAAAPGGPVPGAAGGNETVVVAPAIEGPPVAVSTAPEEIGTATPEVGGSPIVPGGAQQTIPPPFQDCPVGPTFLPTTVLLAPAPPAPSVLVTTIQQCALECYRRNCSTAVFDLTDTSHMEGEPCYLSFGVSDCTNTTGLVTNYAARTPVQLTCVSCEVATTSFPELAPPPNGTIPVGPEVPAAGNETVPIGTLAETTPFAGGMFEPVDSNETIPFVEAAATAPSEGAVTPAAGNETGAFTFGIFEFGGGNESAPAGATPAGVIAVEPPVTPEIGSTVPAVVCPTSLTFETVPPTTVLAGNVTDHEVVASAKECASLCYARSCSLAGYSPGGSPEQPGLCSLSYGVPSECDRGPKVNDINGTTAITIHCVQCGSEEAPAGASGVIPSESGIPVQNDSHVEEGSMEAGGLHRFLEAGPSFITLTPGNSGGNGNNETAIGPATTSANTATVPPNDGTPCGGRVTFQVEPADESLRQTFSNDQPAGSASECALLCYNTKGCQVAAYLPQPGGTAGVCLFSTVPGKCSSGAPEVAQTYQDFPLVINCIKCSACTFNLRAAQSSVLPDYETQIEAASILDCVQSCTKSNCTSAAYSGHTGKANCLLSSKTQRNCEAAPESRLDTTAPVMIDCIQCRG